MKFKSEILIYLKGMLMGIADLIPGISGGTIAFICSIYERLIFAISNINYKNIKILLGHLIKKRFSAFKDKFIELDMVFLLILFAGIFTSIILFSKIILYLFTNYNSYVLIFFCGLIIASSKVIFKQITNRNFFNSLFGIGGFFLGISLLYLIPVKMLNPDFVYIIFSGFIAVFALFLPGVSGSFILLILGMYQFILNAISNFDFYILSLFLFGAIFGVFFISRLVKFLFKKDKSKTLFFLTGLTLGALAKPIIEVNSQTKILQSFELIMLLFIGFGIVLIIEKLVSKN